MRGIHLTLTVVLGACATTGLPPCPQKGGPAWREVVTDHFVVYTDLSGPKAVAAARDLEFVRSAMAQILVPGWSGPPGRIPVVVLAGERSFAEFFSRDAAGIYGEVLLQPTVFMSGTSSISQEVIIKHELTHFLVDGYVSLEHLPRWVAEGLASFTETVEVDRGKGRVTVGKTADERVIFALAKYYPQRIMMRYDVLKLSVGDGAFYGQSWLKVHYLINVHGPAFGAFLDGLHAGKSESEAWSEAFPAMSEDDLEKELPRYAQNGKYRIVTLRMAVPEIAVSERPMQDADVHAWRALMYTIRSKRKVLGDAEAARRAREEIAEARRQEATQVLALAAQAWLDDDVAVADLRRAADAHPDSWLAWWLLSDAYKKAGDEKAAWDALKEALRRAAGNPAIRLQQKLQKRTASEHS